MNTIEHVIERYPGELHMLRNAFADSIRYMAKGWLVIGIDYDLTDDETSELGPRERSCISKAGLVQLRRDLAEADAMSRARVGLIEALLEDEGFDRDLTPELQQEVERLKRGARFVIDGGGSTVGRVHTCRHGKRLTDYCEPCGRIRGGG